MHTLRRHGSITPAELAAALADYVVVDVRDRAEWEAGHVTGSLHLTPERLAGDWPDPDPRLPVAIVATDEPDADRAVRALRGRGRDAIMVSGDETAWAAARHLIVTNRP